MERKFMRHALRLVSCTACHAAERKVVGPAYKDVGKKYAGDASAPSMLAAKILAQGEP
jgi:cytochrome c